MQGIVMVIVAVLLLSPGIVTAAESRTAQVTPVTAALALPKKLDLNRVSVEELVGVPGIGQRMAQAIVDLRQKKGSFKRVEDLLEVSGIKEKKLATISGFLEVIPLQASTATTSGSQSR